jgi:hypothetical protein
MSQESEISDREDPEESLGERLLKETEFTDVNFKIVYNNKVNDIYAHKAPLAVTCSNLKEQFRHWQNHTLPQLILKANKEGKF